MIQRCDRHAALPVDERTCREAMARQADSAARRSVRNGRPCSPSGRCCSAPSWSLLIGTFPYFSGTNSYVLLLLGKFLCFAIFALSIDLIWGFAGILSLGQAVYFGIGAYFVALSLKINYAIEHPTRYGSKFPDFMEWNGLTELPAFMSR